MPSIDVTLVSGRRPELLQRMLESFRARVLKNFAVDNFFANIDPFGGNEDDHNECRALLARYLPNVIITEPETPSLGMAVKQLWTKTVSPYVLHLEDDWLALEDITPDKVFPLFNTEVRTVKFISKEHKLRADAVFCQRIVKSKIFGVTVRRQYRNKNGTSPSFFEGQFLREWANLLDPQLDPEKQIRQQINAPLFNHVTAYKCRMLAGQQHRELILDIGRQWRDDNGIVKTVAAGKSTWDRRHGS